MRYDRECLYDVEWQQLRVSLLGTWNTIENVRQNIETLHIYHQKGAGVDQCERAIRCSNYLSAILLGYGSREQFKEFVPLISSRQRWFSDHSAGPYASAFWNWNKVEQDLNSADLPFLKALRANLSRRVYTSIKRTGGTQFRPELETFLKLLDKELRRRDIPV